VTCASGASSSLSNGDSVPVSQFMRYDASRPDAVPAAKRKRPAGSSPKALGLLRSIPTRLAVADRHNGEALWYSDPSLTVEPTLAARHPPQRLPECLRARGRADRRVLAELGLGDGDRLRIGNRRGSVVVRARGFDGLQTRVVIVEGLWPNHAFEEGIGINLLTSADPGLPRGGAVFHDTSVWLSPA
jgi:hypothetical protein